jgi:uncharacterized protein involved in exopolysaccharide biosynthesis
MTTNPPDKLDRIEAILLSVSQGQQDFQRRQQQTQNQIDALLALYDGLEQRLEQDRISVSQGQQDFQTKQQQTQNQIDALLALYGGLEQRLEQDRNQAEIDRREFRSTIEAVLDVLRDRFTSNGQ